MTRPNRHRVQRQIVEVAIGDSTDGPAVHRELARPFWDRAVPELERVFDSAAGPDELLRLDRLELNLGAIDGADWPAEFRRKLVAELTRSLTRFTAVPDASEGHARLDSRRVEPWHDFLFFLSHGYLPWWGARPRDGWTEALVNQLEAAGWSALRDAVVADSRARLRFVQTVSDGFLEAAIARWAGVPDSARVLARWTTESLRADGRQRWRRGFWMAVLECVRAGGFRSPGGGVELVRDLLRLRSACLSESGRCGPSQPSSQDDSVQGTPIPAVRDDELPDPWRGWVSRADAAPSGHAVFETRAGIATRHDATRPEPASLGAGPNRSPRSSADEAIYLDGAGAILLHPFLERLFADRSVLSERKFRDADARTRAVHLLGLLTFGHADVAEHELVLAKVLCGCALEEPLEPVRLEDDDVAACDAVLRAVLEHWKALRSSSPEWLRQQFLLREGKLEPVEGGFLLTVERRAQDVLLARMPWGFGVVGLPWLTDRMFVRWIE